MREIKTLYKNALKLSEAEISSAETPDSSFREQRRRHHRIYCKGRVHKLWDYKLFSKG